tara:strand:- start:2362 stop:2565 length:204 start_codon:yes stop_codon:yes gene_type:complete
MGSLYNHILRDSFSDFFFPNFEKKHGLWNSLILTVEVDRHPKPAHFFGLGQNIALRQQKTMFGVVRK